MQELISPFGNDVFFQEKFYGDGDTLTLRKINKEIKIQVDGGVNEKSIKKLAKLGVSLVNSGSFISQSENPKEAFNKLTALFEKYKKR